MLEGDSRSSASKSYSAAPDAGRVVRLEGPDARDRIFVQNIFIDDSLVDSHGVVESRKDGTVALTFHTTRMVGDELGRRIGAEKYAYSIEGNPDHDTQIQNAVYELDANKELDAMKELEARDRKNKCYKLPCCSTRTRRTITAITILLLLIALLIAITAFAH